MPHRLQYFCYHLFAPWNTIEVGDIRFGIELNRYDRVLNHCHPTFWSIVNQHRSSCNLVVGDRGQDNDLVKTWSIGQYRADALACQHKSCHCSKLELPPYAVFLVQVGINS